MTKQNDSKKRVHNLIIVDESGSMEVIRKQAFVGMNETLQTVRKMQEKFPDQEQFVTLLTFDTGHTTWHYDNLPAAQTNDLDWKAYCPGGGTPLYDAIGKGISKTNAQIEEGDHVLETEEAELDFHTHRYRQPRRGNYGSILRHRRASGVPSGYSWNHGHVCPRTSQPRTLQLLCRRRCRHAHRFVLQ